MAGTTLRERNKGDKLRRITAAARTLFARQGFDATSTRDIAAHAGVALATLFLYASDKRDLLFLACNDDLEALTHRAFGDVAAGAPIREQIVAAFAHFFSFYARDRRLSRDLLRELTFFTSGQHSARFQATRQMTIAAVETLIVGARERGMLRSAATDAEIARVIFYVFAAEVRHWLAQDDQTPQDGVERFGRLLDVIIAGLE
jgi:AcrR family transcriptional regulator